MVVHIEPAKIPDEIEVTPEMIGEAHEVLIDHALDNGAYDLTAPVLVELFRAMHRRMKKSL